MTWQQEFTVFERAARFLDMMREDDAITSGRIVRKGNRFVLVLELKNDEEKALKNEESEETA